MLARARSRYHSSATPAAADPACSASAIPATAASAPFIGPLGRLCEVRTRSLRLIARALALQFEADAVSEDPPTLLIGDAGPPRRLGRLQQWNAGPHRQRSPSEYDKAHSALPAIPQPRGARAAGVDAPPSAEGALSRRHPAPCSRRPERANQADHEPRPHHQAAPRVPFVSPFPRRRIREQQAGELPPRLGRGRDELEREPEGATAALVMHDPRAKRGAVLEAHLHVA